MVLCHFIKFTAQKYIPVAAAAANIAVTTKDTTWMKVKLPKQKAQSSLWFFDFCCTQFFAKVMYKKSKFFFSKFLINNRRALKFQVKQKKQQQ